MRRTIKLAMLVAGILGLVATSAPPAQATTVAAAAFAVNVTLGGPLATPFNALTPTSLADWTVGNPTTPNDVITRMTQAVLGTTGSCGHGALPLPTGLLVTEPAQELTAATRQCHINPGGHTRAITALPPVGCVNAGVNVNKLAKAPAHLGVCQFAMAAGKSPEGNHVHGYCGLSGGQVQVRFTDALGQIYTLDLHFEGYVALIVLLGHWTKLTNTTQSGLFHGVAVAVPVPTVTGTTLGNSCSASTASVFTVAGVAALLPHV